MKQRIIDFLESTRQPHYYCEDSWYSCPLAEEGCADDSIDPKKCRCGADDLDKKLDDMITDVKENYGKED